MFLGASIQEQFEQEQEQFSFCSSRSRWNFKEQEAVSLELPCSLDSMMIHAPVAGDA